MIKRLGKRIRRSWLCWIPYRHRDISTGGVTVSGGIGEAGGIANSGSASRIGQSSNAADNLIINGGTFSYGNSNSQNISRHRLFSIRISNGTLSFTNNATMSLTNTGAQ